MSVMHAKVSGTEGQQKMEEVRHPRSVPTNRTERQNWVPCFSLQEARHECAGGMISSQPCCMISYDASSVTYSAGSFRSR
jgi:hypothetical protein